MKRSDAAFRFEILARAFAALILIGVGTYLQYGLSYSLLTVGGLLLIDAWIEGLQAGRVR